MEIYYFLSIGLISLYMNNNNHIKNLHKVFPSKWVNWSNLGKTKSLIYLDNLRNTLKMRAKGV